MDGDMGTWWMVLCALLVVLALPTGGSRAQRRPERSAPVPAQMAT